MVPVEFSQLWRVISVEKNTFLPEVSLEEQTLRATLTETGEYEIVEYAVQGSPAWCLWSLVSCDGLFQSKITHFYLNSVLRRRHYEQH